MHWRIKAHLLALASRTPGALALYHLHQDRRAADMSEADEMLDRSLDLLALVRDTDGELRGRDCLEIGTGWCPWLPLLLRVAGAARIVTIDINPWLTVRTALNTTNAMLDRASRVAEAVGVPDAAVRTALEAARGATTLEEWLRALNIEYRCCDLLLARLEGESFDAVFSSNVLEHVPPDALRAIHHESRRLLRAGGRVFHRFNPQDHFCGSDRSITGANFLQFSAEEWWWLGGSGLSYHNRLRCPQHRDLVTGCGFNVVMERTRPDARAREAIESGRLAVHQDFAGFDLAGLTDDYMWIVAEAAPDAPGHRGYERVRTVGCHTPV
jgi:SAM-dependent methyltransferase